MKIALVAPSVGWVQGVPHYVAALGRALSHEHEVHLVAGQFNPLDLDGVEFHKVLAFPWSGIGFHASFMANLHVRHARGALVTGYKFDIVHGAGHPYPFADVVTAHFIQAREQRLLAGGVPGMARKTWRQGVKGWDYRLYAAFASFMERRYYSTLRPKIVIAISQNVKDDLIREFGVPDEMIVTIPNGVDTQRFNPTKRLLYRQHVRRQLGLNGEDTVALFVGNSWDRKGLGPAIQAVRSIADPGLKLLVVGAGDPLLFCSQKELRDPHRKVVFVDSPQPQIERYYAAADLFLLPTLYEPFGLVVLEALASGLPVVVSSAAGVAEHITDGETGLLLHDPADPHELQAKLELLLNDRNLSERLASQGRLLAEEFSWDRIAALTLDAYRLALESGGKAGRESHSADRSDGGGIDASRPAA